MLRCKIGDERGDVTVIADGDFETIAINIAQVIRAIYDQIKKNNEDAGQYFRDGFTAMINDERIWNTDSLIAGGLTMSQMIYAEEVGED